jgi:hypothetical protein
MKKTLPTRILLGAFLAATVATTHAAPLQRADVINEPHWVLHVDADALRPTAIGQFLLTELEKPEAQKKFAAFQAIFSFDPRKELHGVTLYGASKAEEDGVLLIHADFDAARLTTLAEGAKDHKSSTHRQHTIHNWIDEKKAEKKGVKPRTYAAIHGKVVILGQKESRVAEALDVLDRAKPNLETNPQFGKLGDGAAFIQGAARKLELPENDPNAAVFKQAKSVMLKVNENQGKLEAALTLEANSEAVAKNLEAIGRGLIALLSLQREKPEAQKLAKSLSVQQAGATVVVQLSLPSGDVIELLKVAEAKKKAAKESK